MNYKLLTVLGLALGFASAPVFASAPHFVAPVEESDDDDDDDDKGAQREAEKLLEKREDGARQPSRFLNRPDSRIPVVVGKAVFQSQQMMLRENSAGMESKETKDVIPAETCVWFCDPSVFAEYGWVDSRDDRRFGADGQTHSVTGGLSFTTIGGINTGLIYSYSRMDLDDRPNGTGSISDSHFISLFFSKSFLQYLYVGVTGGYGHTDVQSFLRERGFLEGQDVDTWHVSPYLGVAYVTGAFQAAFNVAYTYAHSETDAPSGNNDADDGKVIYTLNLGYAVTERLTLSALGKFTHGVHYEDAPADFPEDREWFTVGGRIAYRPLERLEIYGGYEYDINDNYSNHTVNGGLTYTF